MPEKAGKTVKRVIRCLYWTRGATVWLTAVSVDRTKVMSTKKNLDEIIDLMRRDDSIDAPADSIRWARNLFKTRAAAPPATLMQKLVAVLQMEIKPNTAAFGERSATTSQIRQMLYRAGENAVDIRVGPANKGFEVRGQILGDGFARASLRLFNDTNVYNVRANENSEFSIEKVPADKYDLVITGDEAEITLKTIDIA